MSGRVRIINSKGDWTDTPPTGADDHDLQSFANDFVVQGGVVDLAGGDCLVEESDTPGMHVKVSAGVVYVENSSWTQNSFEPRYYIVTRDAEETNVAISSNPSGSTRIDLICQEIDKVTTPDEDGDNVAPITVVEGTPGAGQPSTPADHELLAVVEVEDGATSITNSEITDSRRQVLIGVPYKTAQSETTNLGNLGTTETIDFDTGTFFKGTLDNNVTITISNLSDGQRGQLILYYDGSTQRTITWSGIDVWIGGQEPDAPDTSGEPLVVTLISDGNLVIASGGIAS